MLRKLKANLVVHFPKKLVWLFSQHLAAFFEIFATQTFCMCKETARIMPGPKLDSYASLQDSRTLSKKIATISSIGFV